MKLGGIAAAAVLVAAASSALAWSRDEAVDPQRPVPAPPIEAEAETRAAYENTRAGDYVGPQACAGCHEERYAQWRAHPHSRMNQNADGDAVLGDFSGVSRDYGGVRTQFEMMDGAPVMSHYRGSTLLRRDRVTRTIGSRLQQAYVGVQVFGPEPADHPLYTNERALPYVYWLSRRQWYPEHYVEQYPAPEHHDDGTLRYPTDDPYARGTRPWVQGCMRCHNTYAYEYRFHRPSPGLGFADVAAQPGAELPSTGPMPDQLVTLGVSCESCHFGGRAHVQHDEPMRYVPVGSALQSPAERTASGELSSTTINSICAQCHVAGLLPYPSGAASGNSSEALDMLGGACNTATEHQRAIACTDCHDPHVAGPDSGGPERPAHVAACTGCHERFAEADARRAHARHDDGIATCLDCHMIRITQGIDTVVRSHRIDSPTNVSMLAAAAPNACNLCHLDETMAWTLQQLRSGWDADIEPAEGWQEHYGPELDRPVGRVWLQHESPPVRLVATDAYARSAQGPRALGMLVEVLMDPYPQNRMFALDAIERIVGRRIGEDEYQPTATAEQRERQVRRLVWSEAPPR